MPPVLQSLVMEKYNQELFEQLAANNIPAWVQQLAQVVQNSLDHINTNMKVLIVCNQGQTLHRGILL